LQLNRFQGTLSVYQSNISKHKQELKQTQYKDIEKRYTNQLLQLKVDDIIFLFHILCLQNIFASFKMLTWLQTTEMANKDLDRYYSALDK
jgi:DNA repair protein RAD50